MRLLLIAIASLILFFPLFWALNPFFGQDWGAWIAAFLMFIVFPTFLLKSSKPSKPSKHPLIKACNYLLAIFVLGLISWVLYNAFFNNAPIEQAYTLTGIISAAIYFLKHGYMPYQEKEFKNK